MLTMVAHFWQLHGNNHYQHTKQNGFKEEGNRRITSFFKIKTFFNSAAPTKILIN